MHRALRTNCRQLSAEVLFVGGHVYKSRVIKDTYDIEDVVEEAESALSEQSVVIVTHCMTAIQNPNPRADRPGNHVKDRTNLGCTKYRLNPELFSTPPKGDCIKPPQNRKGRFSFSGPSVNLERFARETSSSGSSRRSMPLSAKGQSLCSCDKDRNRSKMNELRRKSASSLSNATERKI